ncbi:MAG TPA: hypothetical protein VF652_11150 [Allosphingosinicella sp.]
MKIMSSESLAVFGNWAQIASAVGTLAAVIVALFGPQIRRVLVRPRLNLTIENPVGVDGTDWVPDGTEEGISLPARWYHLRVSNPHRWSPVTMVRVFLLEIEAPDASGRYRRSWIGEVPIDWRFPKQVGPVLDFGFPRDCDLCSATSDKRLRLKQAIPWGIPEELLVSEAPVDLRLTLQARGLEADSGRLRVRLCWNGVLPDDRSTMDRHLVLEKA